MRRNYYIFLLFLSLHGFCLDTKGVSLDVHQNRECQLNSNNKLLPRSSAPRFPAVRTYNKSEVLLAQMSPATNVTSTPFTQVIHDNLSSDTTARASVAFQKARQTDNVEAYQGFLRMFPHSEEAKAAQVRISDLAFEIARKENTASAYQKFISNYPSSSQFSKAGQLFEIRQFAENTTINEWTSYAEFIKKFSNNPMIVAAQDSIMLIGKRKNDLKALKYCVDNFSGERRKKALQIYHDVYTDDGEILTLDLFYKTYGNEFTREVKLKEYEAARYANKLLLHLPYSDWKFAQYDHYIRMAAPNERAFVTLQRLISFDIMVKNWPAAIKKVNEYKPLFDANPTRINELLRIMTEKWNASLKIFPVGSGVNTPDAGEYSPVVSADENLLYFCGMNRPENIGGEDIFVSEKKNGVWGKAKLVPGLSSKLSNDAPISISADGTIMLLFRSGKLVYAQKTSTGWSKPMEFPKTINGEGWQIDGQLTSDGKGLIFSSTRSGGYNIFNHLYKFHGDELYQSDIYISLFSDNNKWTEPVSLGGVINTPYCERMPYLHADMKTLYFSSDGHGGLGKLDVFKSTRLADSCWNCWSEPVNLGKEMNTQESDAGYKISTSGEKAYFSYERKNFTETSMLLLMDVSGSMSGRKLEALKQATTSVCQTAIQNNCEVSILTYADDCREPIKDSCSFTRDINKLLKFIQNIRVGGGTPTYEAYDYASNYVNKHSDPKSKIKVITLLTDGDANVCTPLDSVLYKIKKRGNMYKTQTILYDLSDQSIAFEDLQKISTVTNGKFYSAQKFEDLGSAFEAANNDIFNFSTTGDKDIYWLALPKYLRPNAVATVSGKLIDKNDQPVSAQMRWDDLETGKNVGKGVSDPETGSYYIVLPLGKIYGYYAEKDSYFPLSGSVDLRDAKTAVNIKNDFNMLTIKDMIEAGTAVRINNVFFDFSKSDLLPTSTPDLRRVANIIKSRKLRVELRGHTDNVGTDEGNQALSEWRAQAVKAFLVSEGCVANDIDTVGFGEKSPSTTNTTAEGRALNRRVEIRFTE